MKAPHVLSLSQQSMSHINGCAYGDRGYRRELAHIVIMGQLLSISLVISST